MFNEKNVILLAQEVLKLSHELKILSRNKNFTVTKKSDSTSVTTADLYSDLQLKKIFAKIFGKIDVLSEEDTLENQHKIAKKGDYFIIDPIDGTECFILGDDFCVNIAYCKQNVPIFGMIALPLQNIVYYTFNDAVYSLDETNKPRKLSFKSPKNDKLIIAVGRKDNVGNSRNKLDSLVAKKEYQVEAILTKNAGLKYLTTILGISSITINFTRVKDWDIAMIYPMCKIAGLSLVDSEDKPVLFGLNNFEHNNGTCLIKKA